MADFAFRVEARCPHTAARTGLLETPHGPVTTPAFMPVGTRGSVRGILPADLRASGAQVVLANTYHLTLRPGSEVVAALGGLHRFMGWDGPILTDSGGYQVFSLRDIGQVDEDGASLKSVVDGAWVRFTPEGVMRIQRELGADIVMAFDHCPAAPKERDAVADATERTHRWLGRCVESWRAAGGTESGQALFGIVQGGAFEDLRRASVEAVLEHDLPGYAIGGVSLGEERDAMLTAVDAAAPLLPEDRPRYLMGVGTPLDFVEAVRRGVDMFDCVTPTRHGRTHQAFTWSGRLNLRNEAHRLDPGPLDPQCDCVTCRDFPRGALRHFCKANEMLAGILLSLHNLHFFQRLMDEIRSAIAAGTLPALAERIAAIPDQRRL